MNRFLSRINLLLGSLSLLLAGCHTPKHASKSDAIMVLYGVGLEDYAPVSDITTPERKSEAPLPTDTVEAPIPSRENALEAPLPTDTLEAPLKSDTVEAPLTPRGDRPSIMVKYGVMPPKRPVSE